MRILFLTTSHNSLSQRAFVELTELGHEISIEYALSDEIMREAVALFRPDLIISPMLKRAIPEDIWRNHTCLIVHPGIKGDRGPSSLDWAIDEGEQRWGVTVLQAIAEMDAGPIWAAEEFALPLRAKSTVYRHQVTEAAMRCLLSAVERFERRDFVPKLMDSAARGRLRPSMKQADRAIEWATDTTDRVMRRIHAADSSPGVLDRILDRQFFLYGAHPEDRLRGTPGEIIATKAGAICRATVDGAVWISHLREKLGGGRIGIKLPAVEVVGAPLRSTSTRAASFEEIRYDEKSGVGYLYFDFYNGAMNEARCDRLREAYLQARQRPTRVIVLMGGHDFWSNGIDLNQIEASSDPAGESWRNILAIDELVREILETETHLVVAAVRGNAGAGGAMMALAADEVLARCGVILNLHYRSMGLHGSEYWTYTLPRRVGARRALELTESCRPIGVVEAIEIGVLDAAFGEDVASFDRELTTRAEGLARSSSFAAMLEEKRKRRRRDEAKKPLAAYRSEELRKMRESFFSMDSAYHLARSEFVRKLAACQTPPRLAIHRVEPQFGNTKITSMRRFLARPSEVELSATGRSSP